MLLLDFCYIYQNLALCCSRLELTEIADLCVQKHLDPSGKLWRSTFILDFLLISAVVCEHFLFSCVQSDDGS